MLLTVVIVMGIGSSYQIESAEGQLPNTSSVSELVEKANSLYNMSKYEESITWYDKALEIDPKNVDTLYSKALAHDNLERYEEAISIDSRLWYLADFIVFNSYSFW
jgi:tetratricopeptide (TPR) repeat protein